MPPTGFVPVVVRVTGSPSTLASTSSASDTVCVAPDLLSHVKEVVEKDASILKNLRKARDEREQRKM